jgi:diketogulonate reductase-like aldo/keto reductase
MLQTIQPIDPALVLKKKLNTGDEIPVIGLGTFASDNYDNPTVAEAVRTAVRLGYRHIDCASVYGNEKEIGAVIGELIAEGTVTRAELWITSKVWNDSHGDVEGSCRRTLDDLGLDYLDLYLVHWPFANSHAKGVSVESRDPGARPYSHEAYRETWRAMETLVDKGWVRNIGTSNMTRPKMERLLADCRIRPAVNEMELHPHFQQPEWFDYLMQEAIQPIGFCPLGSPNRPERDRTPDDTSPMEDPVIRRIAEAHGVHPAVVCLTWGVQRGEVDIPFSVKAEKIASNLSGVIGDPLSAAEMEAIGQIDRGCRLVKGQVFCWPGATWEDLWD